MQEALEIQKRYLGEDQPEYAQVLVKLAFLHFPPINLAKLWKTNFFLIRALKIDVKALGWRNPQTHSTAFCLVAVLLGEVLVGMFLGWFILFFLQTRDSAFLLQLVFYIALTWLLVRPEVNAWLRKRMFKILVTYQKKQRQSH